ncbi:hypothetical protein M3O96_03025 [Aquiflexum sp. TKW24L]|uniref:hypothetical protein n=1 Tax=Aquiflexum sp. TKW24L TaxID=2942212 RepID=UPI0020C17BB3|nr:hypothetical protein [Aquiflexum sp. TKW24L]MCL6258043.1 hypothetical protein [Aquiflexum sp. TKW24L]
MKRQKKRAVLLAPVLTYAWLHGRIGRWIQAILLVLSRCCFFRIFYDELGSLYFHNTHRSNYLF